MLCWNFSIKKGQKHCQDCWEPIDYTDDVDEEEEEDVPVCMYCGAEFPAVYDCGCYPSRL